ncbi:DUF1194 domain-containing protein [Rhizobium sp. KVB221]|uniref:DUF1194 domain-containing protein n=1 Tax=Rhizobium setariae TaxID=2801340 RepID=A0A936YUA4_9HYPH|nr:DUF1194 domain-containing protein [Rhizobium setariae]MBL0373032.1 DUF1194 domain-containing protein [Rhizobium setariae]
MCKHLFALATVLLMVQTAHSQTRSCVDIALVLAVDGSGSITEQEYAFQKFAIADAFRDKEVLSALNKAGVVALSTVFWGDGDFSTQKLDWFVVSRRRDAEPFARAMENNQRLVFGNTDIGSGIWSALDLLSNPLICAARSIINVSGDGKETIAPKRRQVASLPAARQRAKEMGVTINALVVSDDVGDLAGYYRKDVIVGADSFVMDIPSFADYRAAIKRKLIKELSSKTVASLVHQSR